MENLNNTIEVVSGEQILDSKELRDKLCERYEVLDKVKQLFLVPNTEVATVKQVAEFYEVEEHTITTMLKDDRRFELQDDGILCLTGKETKEYFSNESCFVTNFRGYFEVNGIRFANNKNILLPRRAILRVGMLLRDSEIAKEVRTQLLNIEEKSSNEIKVQDINEEQSLAMSVGMALASGDINAIAISVGKMFAYKNRHIEKLQQDKEQLENTNQQLEIQKENLIQDNKGLTGELLKWDERKLLNAGIRKLSSTVNKPCGEIWNILYKELQYKHGIQLKKRGSSPFIQHVKENEWRKVLQTFCAICEGFKQSPIEMFQKKVIYNPNME